MIAWPSFHQHRVLQHFCSGNCRSQNLRFLGFLLFSNILYIFPSFLFNLENFRSCSGWTIHRKRKKTMKKKKIFSCRHQDSNSRCLNTVSQCLPHYATHALVNGKAAVFHSSLTHNLWANKMMLPFLTTAQGRHVQIHVM